MEHDNGNNAASLAVAEKYVTAFGELAKETNTVVLPANAGDVTGMVTQALTIYNKLNTVNQQQQQLAGWLWVKEEILGAMSFHPGGTEFLLTNLHGTYCERGTITMRRF